MHVLVLQRPGSSARPEQWLRDAAPDARVTLVTGSGATRDANDLAAGVTRHVLSDYESPHALGELLDLCRDDVPDRVVTNAEVDVLRAAELRTLLGVPGQGSGTALLFRDKVRMRALYADSAVRVPAAAGVRCVADVLRASRELGAVVLKPRDGAGSVGVHVLTDEAAAGALLLARADVVADIHAGRLMVEEFVNGAVLHVDALIEADRVPLAAVSAYLDPPHLFRSANVGSVLLDEDDPVARRAALVVRALVERLPAGHGAHVLHAELYATPGGDLYAGEVACRVGGGLIRDAIRHTYGVDLSQMSCLLSAGLAAAPTTVPRCRPPSGFLLHTGGPELSIPDPAPAWVVRHVPPGDRPVATSSVDAATAVLVEGRDADQVRRRLHSLEARGRSPIATHP